MCGICGVVTARPDSAPEESLIRRMRDRLIHRGPDGAGVHIGPGVGLGHRRLSIVDVEHGHQPMYSSDGRYVTSFNGEIYNHPAIKAELEREGVRYRTRSDTETVLHLFERYGVNAVTKMQGMFAIAVWDTATRTLFLARDRFGIKPLYYAHREDGGLIFGSEIKALLPALSVQPRLNYSALPDFLANHAPSGDETMFEGIRRLPPGYTLSWREGRIDIAKYWDQATNVSISTAPSTDGVLAEEFTRRFTAAVKSHLMSDVPLGVFLSGGLDSAAITATVAGLVPEPVSTFSVAFAEREANELAYARIVSEAYRTKHFEVLVTPQEFFAELPRLVWHEDEPIAHPSSIALYFLSRLAARHVKVVLTGEGSDELLAGYNRYRVTAYNCLLNAAYVKCVPGMVRRGAKSAFGSLAPGSKLGRIVSRTFLTRGPGIDDLYFDNFAVFPRTMQARLLTSETRSKVSGIDPYAAYHRALARVPGSPFLSQILYADLSTYLHELLMKQDQMSMAASIESRVPFLDHTFAEWIATLPQRVKLRGVTTKWILRKAMSRKLPKAILTRRKMGFPVPTGTWFRGQWRFLLNEYVTGERSLARGIFEAGALRALVAEHLSGVNHSQRLWALLNFEIWARIYLDGDDLSSLETTLPQVSR